MHRHPFLLIETGVPVPSLRRHGGFGHWIRVAAGLAPQRAVLCRVDRGDALPRAEGFAGVLVSGSPAMVTERLDWSEATAAWLRAAAARGLPLFGICYGHQLLAHAFDGVVGDNPRGREIGTAEIALHAGAADDPLLGGLGDAFLAHATHQQTVLSPPPGAAVLARSALDDCQAMRIGGAAWGVQFHPEFNVAVMRGYLAARAERLREEGLEPAALAAAVRAAPTARTVLRRFVRFADARAA